ncbi:MAG: hypothetical protein ABI668_11875 [Sphingorhabdus sp.]
MTDKNDKTDADANWSTGAKVGAAVGSAALVAALLYAGKRHLSQKRGKLEPQSPEVPPPVTPGPGSAPDAKPEDDA